MSEFDIPNKVLYCVCCCKEMEHRPKITMPSNGTLGGSWTYSCTECGIDYFPASVRERRKKYVQLQIQSHIEFSEQRERIAMEDVEMVDEAMLESKSVADLKMRLGLLNKIIREAQAKGDPRWQEAARQQRVVNEALVKKIKQERRERGEPEPEPVRIGMKSARMKGRAITGSR